MPCCVHQGVVAAGDDADKIEAKVESGANSEQQAQEAALVAERERRAAKAQVRSLGCFASCHLSSMLK